MPQKSNFSGVCSIYTALASFPSLAYLCVTKVHWTLFAVRRKFHCQLSLLMGFRFSTFVLYQLLCLPGFDPAESQLFPPGLCVVLELPVAGHDVKQRPSKTPSAVWAVCLLLSPLCPQCQPASVTDRRDTGTSHRSHADWDDVSGLGMLA